MIGALAPKPWNPAWGILPPALAMRFAERGLILGIDAQREKAVKTTPIASAPNRPASSREPHSCGSISGEAQDQCASASPIYSDASQEAELAAPVITRSHQQRQTDEAILPVRMDVRAPSPAPALLRALDRLAATPVGRVPSYQPEGA